ncbi:hypothetical protein EJK17_08995 [Lactobacillus xujianguonis]|uniref:Cyanophage baseplate Pam3 plug gp18 domain-containing protein n=1 Tax=Lactobacillus xujianguonis TaxID=2495899 RepID=A0A437STC2_9LACO|nr:hypothetical protein [Lactobacillus xujianguonis]RVU70158.1 hypothetical protein EJK17_08995 [Lactobacillus xujianguonis]RVU73537.1 hypothetical protein EJK20_07845 [Lactobacillus xujianguonis]
MRQHLPVDVENLPDIYDIKLAGTNYTLRLDYNPIADYYTCTIILDGEVLLEQEPLILNQLVGIDIPDDRLPAVDLRVMDETGNAVSQGKGEFGDNVKIYLDVIDPNGSEDVDPSRKPLGYDPDEPDDDTTDEEVSY